MNLLQCAKRTINLGYSGLYQKYARRIYNSIYRIVTHTAEAEDILQETFVTVFKDTTNLAKVASFEGWVKRSPSTNPSLTSERTRSNFREWM
ncbi:RNA polymerase sigma factor [Pedobacter sp. UC225_65]|uniref:RNA polymerase sigma factor n=1 Tax=Pedobacter sp. UC225_65 TaxID=3350173 RepID=UPI00366D3CC2